MSGLRFDGEVQIHADGSEMIVRGAGDTLFVEGALSQAPGIRSLASLGSVAHAAKRFGVTIRVALRGGLEMRLGSGQSERGWVSRLVRGPASIGRAEARPESSRL